MEQAIEPLFHGESHPAVVYEPESGRIRYVNEAALTYYGLPRETLQRLTIRDLPAATNRDQDVEPRSAEQRPSPVMRDGSAWSVPPSALQVDGRTYHVAVLESAYGASDDDQQARSRRQQQALNALQHDPAIADGRFPEATETLLRTAAEALDVRRLGFWRLTQAPPGLCCDRLYDAHHDRISGGVFMDGEQCPSYMAAITDSRVVDAHDASSDPRLTELRDYLSANHISSLLGIPIRLHGELIGVLCHEHVGEARSWRDDEIRFAGEVADHMAQALLNAERRRYQDLLRGMVSLVGPETGTVFCRAVAESVAQLLGASRVCVAQCDPDNPQTARTLALAKPSGIAADITFDVSDPLAAATLEHGVYVVPNDLAYRYPDQPWGAPKDGASFIGIRLEDGDGTTLGLMGAVCREAITEDEDAVALLRIFADRTAVELARLRREPHLLRAAAVLDNASEGIGFASEDGTLLEGNPALADLTGYSHEELTKYSLFEFITEPPTDAIHSVLTRDKCWRGEVTIERRDGGSLPAWLTLTQLSHNEGRLAASRLVALVSDISEIRDSKAALEELANHDPLTGLPGRNLFHERLEHAIRTASQDDSAIALLFLDLDGFKDVNDSLGHSEGDALLREVARRLQSATRSSDTLARIGGDEFVILLEGLEGEEHARGAASRLLEAFHDAYDVAGHQIFLTASIGISFHPRDGTSAESLIQSADTAMYNAKDAGKNQFHFFVPNLAERTFERITAVSALRDALEKDQFHLYYQPQVRITDGTVTGCEALVRWQKPDGRMAPAAEFIPVAERSGLINPLGERILEGACTQARQWLDEGLDFGRMAVNVATAQISRPAFADELLAIMERADLPGQRLTIETTESLFLEPHDVVSRTLAVLRDAGVEIAIDDFGTGYSSLAYLKRLPIDTLKLDKSFIQGITNDADDVSITQAMVGLARNLGMSVVAEGIETVDQEVFLATLNCPHGQGFRYSHPVSAEEYHKTLRQTACASNDTEHVNPGHSSSETNG